MKWKVGTTSILSHAWAIGGKLEDNGLAGRDRGD